MELIFRGFPRLHVELSLISIMFALQVRQNEMAIANRAQFQTRSLKHNIGNGLRRKFESLSLRNIATQFYQTPAYIISQGFSIIPQSHILHQISFFTIPIRIPIRPLRAGIQASSSNTWQLSPMTLTKVMIHVMFRAYFWNPWQIIASVIENKARRRAKYVPIKLLINATCVIYFSKSSYYLLSLWWRLR